MKIKPSRRWIAWIRIILLGLGLGLVAGMEFGAGEFLALRFSQTAASGTDFPQAPSVSLADMFAAAR